MSIITHILVQTGKLFSPTTDSHGDSVLGVGIDIACRFRYMTGIEKQLNREDILSEAIIWVEADVNITEGSVIGVEDKYWRVKKYIEARNLSDSNIQFIKCFVDKYAV